MDPYESSRLRMVDDQLAARGMKDPFVLAAMRTVRRHLFVPPDQADIAYEDHPIPIGYGQTISQPYMVALMTELLELEPEHRVLEIGTGSGYQAAVLAFLVDRVFTVERIPELAAKARDTLDKHGFVNVEVIVGDGSLGWPESAPYDRIIVTAAAPSVPKPLVEQLADDGKLVIPVGDRDIQDLQLIHKIKGRVHSNMHGGCRFVGLIGEKGWQQ